MWPSRTKTTSSPTDAAAVEDLRRAIRELHGCEATWIESVAVRETFEGRTVWEGVVQVFSLDGHPTATRCYAWSHATTGEKRRFVAVLHQGPVDSPQAAVQAAIIQEQRERRFYRGGAAP